MIPYHEIEPRTCICFVYAELFMKHNIISMRKRWNILSVNLFFRASSFVTVFLHRNISASQNNYRTFLNPYSLGLQTYSIKNAKCIKFVSVVFFSSFKCSAEKIFIQALVGVHVIARLTVLGSPCRKTKKNKLINHRKRITLVDYGQKCDFFLWEKFYLGYIKFHSNRYQLW